MSQDIFKQNIAGKLASAMGPLLFDIILIKVAVGARTGGALTAGPALTETSYTVKGFTDSYAEELTDGQNVQQNDLKVSILGATLPSGILPEIGDKVTSEDGSTKKIIQVDRDPAGAIYGCQVR